VGKRGAVTSFKDRIARSAGRPVDAACAVRPPGTLMIWAGCAGVSAGIGGNVADSLAAALVGGGAGALIGYPIAWLRHRGSGLSTNMALVLTEDRLELLRLTPWRSRVARTIRAVPLSAIGAVDVRRRLFESRITVQTDDEPIVVNSGRRGAGNAPKFVAEFRRRIAAVATPQGD
jgi:hypothetical protein